MVALLYAVPPAGGYEFSVYEAYPWYFWVAVVGTMFSGVVVILQSARAGREDDRSWLFGLALAFLANAVLAFMPYIRGYQVYGRADVLTHIGYVKNISQAGIFGAGNIYPNTHVFVQVLSYATGLDPMHVIGLLPPLVSVVYFGAMSLLVVHLFGERDQVLFALAFVVIPVAGSAHVVATPFGLSNLLLPFALYLFVKEQQTNALPVRAALVVSIVAMVIYHPLTTLFLILAFGLYLGAKLTRRFDSTNVGPTNVASLTLVVFTAWYYNFVGILLRFEFVLNSFLASGQEETQLESYSETISRTSPDLLDLVRVGVFKYGVEGILAVLGIIFVLVAVWLWRRRTFTPDIFTVMFAATFGAFTLGSVVFLVNDFIVGFGRPLLFSRPFAVVLAGAVAYLLWRHAGSARQRLGVNLSLYLVLLVLVYLATFSMFYSPLASRVNHQVTDMEVEGTEWVFENGDDHPIDEFGISHARFYDMHYGTYDTAPHIRREGTIPPEHFNYTTNQYLGQSYDRDQYLLLTNLGRNTYPEKFPNYREFWRFTPQDFDRLETDRTVTKVYDNGEFDGYLVRSVDGPVEAGSAPTATAARRPALDPASSAPVDPHNRLLSAA